MPVCTKCSLGKRKPFCNKYTPSTLIFAANLEMGMASKSLKSLLVAAFSVFSLFFSVNTFASETPAGGAKHEETAFDPSKLIMEHIMDAHEYHFATLGEKHISIPLPVILYSPQRGWSMFNYSKFNHGHDTYQGYKSEEGHIIPVNEAGEHDTTVTVYDLSLTRNVVQMFIAVALLCFLMIKVANKYKRNGSKVAPSGFQNAVEPVITFVRDEVGKPNLGNAYEKYMPYLLTVFFFILINNLLGLIPGSANVTGNIAFTIVLGFISFLVIVFSTNKHFWGHIFNPPVPGFVKPILVPVEFFGIFTKPFALIVRLFANMVAGHIVITCFVMLIFIFGAMSKVAGWGFAPVSLAFTTFIYFIEILVAFIQAFIFTNLTAVFIGQSMEGAHHDEAHH